jgi:hypothetical protein
MVFFRLKMARFIRNTSVTKSNATVTKGNTCVTETLRNVTQALENVTFTPLKPLLYRGVTFRYVFSVKSALFRIHFLKFGYHFLFSPILYLIAAYKNTSFFMLTTLLKTSFYPLIHLKFNS